MKRVFIIGLTIINVLILAGCNGNGAQTIFPGREELQNLVIIRAIGIDKSPVDPEYVRVTVTSKVQEQGGGGGKQEQDRGGNVMVMTSDGKTAFEAARMLQKFAEKRIFYGHVEYCLIGDSAAREDLLKYLDFVTRGQELRLNLNVYIVKGMTAETFLSYSKEADFFVPEQIETLTRNAGVTSTSGSLELVDLMGRLDDIHNDIAIPVLQANEGNVNSKDRVNIGLDGFAVFRGAKLISYSETNQSLGINFITNKMESGVLVVKDSTGEDVSLEIINSNTKIIPKFDGNRLTSIHMKTGVESNIAEQQSRKDIYELDEIGRLKDEQAKLVKQYINDALSLAKENKIDFLGIGDRIYHKHPVKWQQIKDNWKETFSDINFEITVDSTIRRTYNIREPNAYKVGEIR